MKGLVAAGLLFVAVAVFFLVLPATQLRKDDDATSLRDQAFLVANISQALAQSSMYKVLVAQFYAEHEYFPSSLEEVNAPGFGGVTSSDADAVPAIEIANFGDIVMRIRDTSGAEVGTVILTASDDESRRLITWKCHTAHFRQIRNYFPTCSYEAAEATQQ